jgi:hypothetical protein
MGKKGKREYVQVLRLLETFEMTHVHGAVRQALDLGAIGYDAVKHLVLCRVERRPPRLDLDIYPYLPCQSALNLDPISAPKIDRPPELSWPGAAQSPCNAAAAGQRGFGLRYARFLKRQLSFPVSTISQ